MGRLFLIYLDGNNIYRCKHCQTHIALTNDLMSKGFLCKHGKAYLFDKIVNVTLGESGPRTMMTGTYIVADVFCVGCGSNVGWKYVYAYDNTQKYKEGRFILERFQLLGPDGSLYHFNPQDQHMHMAPDG